LVGNATECARRRGPAAARNGARGRGRCRGPPGSGSPRVAAGWCCGGITGVRKVRGSLAARNRSGGGNSPERGPAKSRRSTGLGPRQGPQEGCWLRGDATALVVRGSGATNRRGRGGTGVRRRGAVWGRRRLGLGEAGVRGRGRPGPTYRAAAILGMRARVWKVGVIPGRVSRLAVARPGEAGETILASGAGPSGRKRRWLAGVWA